MTFIVQGICIERQVREWDGLLYPIFGLYMFTYVDVERSKVRGMGTNLDGTKKSEIDLHGSSLPKENGYGRAELKGRRVYTTVDEIRGYIA